MYVYTDILINLIQFWENQEQLSLEDLGLRASVLAIKDNERLHVRRKEINPINRPKRYELQTICENNKMDPAFVASAVQILTACKLLNTVPPFDVRWEASLQNSIYQID